ncbi:hypothetical protein Tco_0241662 [Tanacetum coccineum]
MEDEHLDAIPAIESDKVIKSSVENLIPTPSESEGIPEKMCDVPLCNNPTPLEAFKEHSKIDIDYIDASPPDSELVSLEVVENVTPEDGEIEDDILREKLSKINLLIAKIEAMNSNPPPSSNFVTKSSSTSLNLFLEETNTFDNSLTESETFCFDLEENSSGSTTTLSDYSLPDYEAFYLDDDHIEEKSSGSTTTHADFSQYDSFIFDLSINPFPPADRSDFYHEEFAGELAHIISPSEYDHFYFKIEPELGNFTMDVVEDIFDNPTREPRVHVPNVLPTHPTLHLDSDFTLSSDSLGSNLVVSFPFGTRNKIFDPGIFIGVQSMIFLSPYEFSFSFIRDPPLPTENLLYPKYDSFIFDLSINPFPPVDRSDFYKEFAGELAHIISPPEYDHFCFKIEPKLGNLTMDVVNDIFPTREPRVHVPNVFTTPTHPSHPSPGYGFHTFKLTSLRFSK